MRPIPTDMVAEKKKRLADHPECERPSSKSGRDRSALSRSRSRSPIPDLRSIVQWMSPSAGHWIGPRANRGPRGESDCARLRSAIVIFFLTLVYAPGPRIPARDRRDLYVCDRESRRTRMWKRSDEKKET